MKKKGRPALGFKKMFTDRVYPEPNTGCWLWGGPISKDGYGAICVIIDGIKVARAHRISYMIHNGPFDLKLLVCHTCDNRLCVNPDHLFLGTPKDNTLDMVKKGRRPKDPRNRKLTDVQILEIRKRIKDGHKQRVIAKEFNVSQMAISCIKLNKTWK